MVAVTGISIRVVDEAQRREVAAVVRAALLHPPYDDTAWVQAETTWADMESWAAWDGADCVGHAGHYRFDTLVPGGRWLPSAGITRVGVLPTHTRRGVLTGLMTDLLLGAQAEGRILANLRATEAGIYGRYGFGVATEAEVVEVDTRKARPLTAEAGSGSCRLIRRESWLETLPELYERVANRSGATTRSRWMWERYLEGGLKGTEAHHVVVHASPDGIDDGFVHYSTTEVEEPAAWHWGRAEVWDLWGTTPQVELALWDHVVNVDLVTLVRVEECPRRPLTPRRPRRSEGVRDTSPIRRDLATAARCRCGLGRPFLQPRTSAGHRGHRPADRPEQRTLAGGGRRRGAPRRRPVRTGRSGHGHLRPECHLPRFVELVGAGHGRAGRTGDERRGPTRRCAVRFAASGLLRQLLLIDVSPGDPSDGFEMGPTAGCPHYPSCR